MNSLNRAKRLNWLLWICLLLAFVVWTPLPLASAQAPARVDKRLISAIDSYINSQMQELRIPGLALGVVQGADVLYLQGYGVADPNGRAVTPQTPFILNSISKSFVALAIMQLVEGGKIELDAPVQRYLPWFQVADETASAQISVRHLLHQTSGLPETAGYNELILATARWQADRWLCFGALSGVG